MTGLIGLFFNSFYSALICKIFVVAIEILYYGQRPYTHI